MSRSCDYANARISARRAQLLGASGLREMATRGELPAQVEVLRRSVWGRALGQGSADAPRDLADVEAALVREESAQRAEIEAFVEPRDRETLRALLMLDAVRALAILLRGVSRGEEAEVVLSRFQELPELPTTVARAVAAAPNIEGAAAALDEARSPVAPILRAALPGLEREPAQLHLEVEMQRAALAGSRAAIAQHAEDREVLAQTVALHVDHVNAATLLTVDTAHGQDLHLEGGRLGRARFACLAALPPAERVAPLAAFVHPPDKRARLGPGDLRAPGVAEQRLAAQRERWLHLVARTRPLSLLVPLSWLVALRGELRRIRVVLRGTAFGLPAEELLDLVEA